MKRGKENVKWLLRALAANLMDTGFSAKK